MNRGTCLLCFTVNVKTYNIKDTHLQYVYEELSDFMFQVHTHLHTLCYICCAKLQQFYQLLKQTRNIQVDYLPLVDLSTVKISNTLQCDCVIIKQEPDIKGESLDFLKVEFDIEESQEKCKVKEAEEERTEHKTPADTKLHSCDICNMKFTQKSNLNTHKLRHSGVKPYSCDICNKTFSERRYLNTHKPTHIGLKPYSCEICNKKFSQKSHLNTHMLTHTGVKPYSCDICEKKFSERHYLNTHKLIHSAVKPYSCDICKKKFSHTGHLKRHKLTHTGVKPYSCDICEKKFNQKGHLSTHKLTHIKTIQHIKTTTIMCPNIQL